MWCCFHRELPAGCRRSSGALARYARSRWINRSLRGGARAKVGPRLEVRRHLTHQLCVGRVVLGRVAHVCLPCALVSWCVLLCCGCCVLPCRRHPRHRRHHVATGTPCAAHSGPRQLHCASLGWGVLRRPRAPCLSRSRPSQRFDDAEAGTGGGVPAVDSDISCVLIGASVVASSCRVVVRCRRFGVELCDRCGGRHHPVPLCAGLVEAFHASVPVHLADCIMAVWRSSVCLGLMDLESV